LAILDRTKHPRRQLKVKNSSKLSYKIRQDILHFKDYLFKEAAAPAIAAAGLPL
jgi:hypothetical protein